MVLVCAMDILCWGVASGVVVGRKRVTMACNCDSTLSLCHDVGTVVVLGPVVVVSSAISSTPSCEAKVPTKTVYQSDATLVF